MWQEGHVLVILVYKITKNFPKEEIYSFVDQIRRAAASGTANIAELFCRHSYKEKIQFYYLSQGSLNEVKNFIFIAKDVGCLSEDDFNKLIEQANITHILLQGLIKNSKSLIFIHKSCSIQVDKTPGDQKVEVGIQMCRFGEYFACYRSQM